MIRHIILVCLTMVFAAAACGGSDVASGGGGRGGVGGTQPLGGTGGSGGSGAGGLGDGGAGFGGAAGAGGEPGPTFTSSREWTDAGLAYQLARCRCDAPAEAISESACLALGESLPFSDRQNECFDDIILAEEQMTLENRFSCLIDVDLDAADCLNDVVECSASAISDCIETRELRQVSCPTPQASVIPMTSPCLMTMVEDGVDAFLDSRSARCDCLPSCTEADRDPETFACMISTLQARVDMLGSTGPAELKCITKFWRQTAVCLGNEVICDGPVTACADLPPMLCEISGAILDACLNP